MNNRLAMVATLLALTCSASANAGQWQADADQWYYSPMIGINFEDTARQADNGLALGVGLGKQLAEQWALELSLTGTRHDGYNNVAQYGVGVDLLRYFDSAGVLSPYLVFGTGWLNTDIVEAVTAFGEQDYSNLVASVGLGFLMPLANRSTRLRVELRYRADLHSPTYNDVQAMVGFYTPFGASGDRNPEPMLDSDRDGVADDIDVCPATPSGTPVDRFGCEPDSDGDGVPDSSDVCPNTPQNTRVDTRGCKRSLDSDRDGVGDDEDLCPGTPRSAKVGQNGCELDNDDDGVVNSLDSCPNTNRGVKVDIRGCELGTRITLPGVQFELNSARLRPGTTASLSQAVATLRRNPDLLVEAAGYTDTTGSAEQNLALSAARADSVRQYLIENGIDAARVTSKGYGEANPVADNATLDGRSRNRRVELRIRQ